jgi:hypothetical protein
MRLDEVAKQGYFAEYEIPFSEKRRWDYLHNWYLSESRHPYFMNTGARKLYVKYPSQAEVVTLNYDNQVWAPSPMNIEDPNLFHALIKLLMSDFFHQRDIFVSNNDFYLLVYVTSKGNAKVLKINLAQQWRENEFFEFALLDSATTLVRAKDIKRGNMHGAHYLIDSKDGLPVLRRLTPSKVTRQLIKEGLYYKPKNTTFGGKRSRTNIRYLDVRSKFQVEGREFDPIQRCRIYHVWQFATDLVAYLNQVGIPFYLKPLEYERVHQISVGKFGKKQQVDISQKTIVVLDDRIRPTIQPDLELPEFSATVTQIVTNIINDEDWTPNLIVKTKADLKPGDLVLRLQDNDAPDFERDLEFDDEGNPKLDDEGNPIVVYQGPLYGHDDPYKLFQKMYGNAITQSLNINALSEDEEEEDDEIEDEDESLTDSNEDLLTDSHTQAQHMGYKLPPKTKTFKIKILNSLYQLHLKDIVRNPENAMDRLGLLEKMRDNIFLYSEGMVYLDGDNLVFRSTIGDESDGVVQIIQERTGWDLDDDIIWSAYERKKYQPAEEIEEREKKNILKNGRFIVNRDYIWQIDDSSERVLPNIPEIQQRRKARETQYPKDIFRPTFSEAELKIFAKNTDPNTTLARERLQSFNEFLDGLVENHLSYNDLHDKRADFYDKLDIRNSIPFEKYLNLREIDVPSPRKSDVIPGYMGISYIRETGQYYVGSKDSFPQSHQQDKGFVFRKVVVHRPKNPPTPDELFQQLQVNLFPLLEVNFIRYKQYTVYPFPFKLIEIWKSI